MAQIDRETRQLFEETYERLVRQRGVTSDAEELALAQELIAEAQEGAVPDDDGTILRVSTGVEPDLDADLADLGKSSGLDLSELDVKKVAVPIAFMVAALVLVVVAIFSGRKGEGDSLPSPAGTATITPTVSITSTIPLTVTVSAEPTSPAVTSTPTTNAGEAPDITPTMQSTAPPVTSTPMPTAAIPEVQSAPVQVVLGNRTLPVVITGVAAGDWLVDSRPDTLSWLAGTQVNKVFALYGEANRDALVSLAPGDRVSVHDDREQDVTYVVETSEPVPRSDTDLLDQTTPGLVVVLAGTGGENRWAVVARPE